MKRVFLTSTEYEGDLADAGGTGEDRLAGGDASCSLVAEAAGIGGTCHFDHSLYCFEQ